MWHACGNSLDTRPTHLSKAETMPASFLKTKTETVTTLSKLHLLLLFIYCHTIANIITTTNFLLVNFKIHI